MKLSATKTPLILALITAVIFTLMGCASSGGSADFSYKSSDQKYDEMAKEAMDDATKSLSVEDLENINKLGK